MQIAQPKSPGDSARPGLPPVGQSVRGLPVRGPGRPAGMTEPDHSLIGSGAAGRATQGETDEALDDERESEWAAPDATPPSAATTPPDMTDDPEMPDADGSR